MVWRGSARLAWSGAFSKASVRKERVWHGRYGPARHGKTGFGSSWSDVAARVAWHGKVRIGRVWLGRLGQARHGSFRSGWLGMARSALVRKGRVRLGRLGKMRLGVHRSMAVGSGWYGVDRQGVARSVLEGQVRYGKARRGERWLGLVRQVRCVALGKGVVRWCFFRQVRMGLARSVQIGNGGAGKEISMVYKWREGGRWKISAQVVGARIEKIRKKNGGNIDARHLVEDSADESSPLHSMFEWDDTEAARQYRLGQARTIICNIMAVPDANPSVGQQRAFVNIREDRRTFTSMERAMSNPDLREQVVKQALTELRGWRARYAAYKELAAVFAALDASLASAA